MTDRRVPQQSDSFWRRINLGTLLIVALLLLIVGSFIVSIFGNPRDWIDSARTGEVQAWAAIAQAVTAILLLALTFMTIRLTQQTAAASDRTADIQAQAQLDTTLPVIVVKAGFWGDMQRLDSIQLSFDNAGNGPALDVRTSFKDGKLRFRSPGLAEVPTAFSRDDETIGITLSIDLDDPFTDAVPNRPRWTEPQPAVSEPEFQAAAIADWTRRHDGFNVQAHTVAERLDNVGTLVLSYRDIHQRAFETRVNLVVMGPFDRDLWPFVQVSQMTFVRLDDPVPTAPRRVNAPSRSA